MSVTSSLLIQSTSPHHLSKQQMTYSYNVSMWCQMCQKYLKMVYLHLIYKYNSDLSKYHPDLYSYTWVRFINVDLIYVWLRHANVGSIYKCGSDLYNLTQIYEYTADLKVWAWMVA